MKINMSRFLMLLLILSICLSSFTIVVNSDDEIEIANEIEEQELESENDEEIEMYVPEDDTFKDYIVELTDDKSVLEEQSHLVNRVDKTKAVINDSIIERKVSKNIMGFGIDWLNNMQELITTSDNPELTGEFLNFANSIQADYGLSRASGGSSKVFSYLDNIGPVSKRHTRDVKSYIDFFDGHPERPSYKAPEPIFSTRVYSFGTLEWIKASYAVSPGCEFVIVLPMYICSPEESANLAELLTYPVGSPSGDKDWAAIRAEYGITEPVKVALYSLGNEMSWAPVTKIESYVEVCKKHMDSILKVDPNARFSLDFPNSSDGDLSEGSFYETRARAIITGLGEYMNYIDALELHSYYCGYAIAHFEKIYDNAQAICESVINRKIPIIVTEHAKWRNAFPFSPKTLFGALSVAQYYNRMYDRDDIYGATYYSLSAVTPEQGNWNTFEKIDGQYMITGVGHVRKLYAESLGENVVKSELIGGESVDIKSGLNTFTMLATTSGTRDLTLILANRHAALAHELTFEFDNNYELVEETVLTGPNVSSYVRSKATKDIFVPIKTEKSEKNFNSYTMPAKSMVVLKLKADKDIKQTVVNISSDNGNGKDEYVSPSDDTGFSDMDGHWASGYVDKLVNDGVINGKSQTEFDPQGSGTRAEFAAMLSRAFDLTTDIYKEQIFDDVKNNEWHFPYISAVFSKGWMRGSGYKAFSPDSPLTLEEMTVTANRICDTDSKINLNILNSFVYKDKISAWAVNDIAQAAGNGIIMGLYENGYFNPNKTASRAEMAYVLYRLKQLKEGELR